MKNPRPCPIFSFFILVVFSLAWPSSGLSQEKVKIGVIAPLTGAIAHTGKDFLTGAEVAADRINAAGGIQVGGKKIPP